MVVKRVWYRIVEFIHANARVWLQFLAAPDKLSFLFEIFSLVDYFTIPPSFVAIYLNRNWLGAYHYVELLLSTFITFLTFLLSFQ